MTKQPKFPWIQATIIMVIICAILYVLLLT